MCIEMFGNIHRPYDQKTPDIAEWGKEERSARGMQKKTAARGQQEEENLMQEDEKKLIAECLMTLKRVEKIIHELA